MVQIPHPKRWVTSLMSRSNDGEANNNNNDEMGEQGTRRELSMVLDEEDEDLQVEDVDLEIVAKEEEERRKRFDEILERGWENWSRETDAGVLKDALIRVLKELRGSGEKLNMNGVGVGRKRSREVDDENEDVMMSNGESLGNDQEEEEEDDSTSFEERAKYIPMRLSGDERKMLRLIEATLVVSEYTDQVDVLTYSKLKTRQRIHSQIKDICSVLTGLVVASDYRQGQRLIKDKEFAQNEQFFKHTFEIARRHKVANPEKMRSTYGKLIHMLQDSVNEEIARILEFSCVKPMLTVTSFLKERGGLHMLSDPHVDDATREIQPPGRGRSRRLVQQEIRHKEKAVEVLAKKYGRKSLTTDDIRRCLYSIGDNNAYLRASRDPCDIMIHYLKKYFGAPEAAKDKRSTLAIVLGRGGARLTHDHKRQYVYVHQSLTLWREVLHEMYKLWYMAESDLLSPTNPYALRNTGQGLNRVQPAPLVGRAMQGIIKRVQGKVGSWVGSSVVHLGDHNVPNALTFLDKYTQVPRILLPITTCIRRLDDVIREDKSVAKYVETNFGGLESARKLILRDFFRHAFDGSGADNFFDAGSCIDGRLTSAWNWCSSLEKKTYYPLFLLTGFVGFDGQW